MFGIGSTELLVILVVALIVLGPKSLASVSRTLGKALGEFRRVSTDFQRTLNAEAAEEEQRNRKQETAKAAREAKEARAAREAAAPQGGTEASQPPNQLQDQAQNQTQNQTREQTGEQPLADRPLTAAAEAEAPLFDVTTRPAGEQATTEQTAPPEAETASAEPPQPPAGSALAEALARSEAEAARADTVLAAGSAPEAASGASARPAPTPDAGGKA